MPSVIFPRAHAREKGSGGREGKIVSQAIRIFPCAHAREKGGGGREGKIRLQGFRSVCRNVGRANQIRAFKVIEHGYVKST